MADRNSIINSKRTHDHKIENGKYVGPNIPPNLDTGWKCLDRARKRMSYSIPGNVLGDSFIQALNTAEGTELFSIWKGSGTSHKVILRNSKDDWNRDVKFINAEKDLGFIVGNTVVWDRLDMKWLITWQDLGIDEYFRGEMRRATHLLRWKDENGFICEQWAAIEGPVETRAKYEQTRGTAIIERRNDSVEIWIGSLDKKAIKSFKKFTRIMINNRAWEVQVRDDITNDSIYRMSLIEDYTNEQIDDVINAIPSGEIDFAPSEENPTTAGIKIVGPNGIKEKVATYFTAVLQNGDLVLDANWSVEGEYQEAELLSDGRFEIIGRKIGDMVTIKIEKDGKTNSIYIRTVSMFSDLDKS